MSEKYFELYRSGNKFFESQEISITDLQKGTSIMLITTNHIVKDQETSIDSEYMILNKSEYIILNKEEMIGMAKAIFDHFGLSYIPEISSKVIL